MASSHTYIGYIGLNEDIAWQFNAVPQYGANSDTSGCSFVSLMRSWYLVLRVEQPILTTQ